MSAHQAPVGKEASVSAAGCLHFTGLWLLRAVVCLGVGLGSGEARPTGSESSLLLRQGTSLGAPGAFGQSPFSQPPAAPHQK